MDIIGRRIAMRKTNRLLDANSAAFAKASGMATPSSAQSPHAGPLDLVAQLAQALAPMLGQLPASSSSGEALRNLHVFRSVAPEPGRAQSLPTSALPSVPLSRLPVLMPPPATAGSGLPQLEDAPAPSDSPPADDSTQDRDDALLANLESVAGGNRPTLKSAEGNCKANGNAAGKAPGKGKGKKGAAKGEGKGKDKGKKKDGKACAKAGVVKKPAAAWIFGCSKCRWAARGCSACRL